LARLNGQLGSLLDVLQDADVAPTAQARAAVAEALARTDAAVARWRALQADLVNIGASGRPRQP
jgi:hypothetical protein